MKTIAETISMKGQREEITMSELRANPGEVFAQVGMGKEFDVSKSGKIVANIQKPDDFDWAALQRIRRMSP